MLRESEEKDDLGADEMAEGYGNEGSDDDDAGESAEEQYGEEEAY